MAKTLICPRCEHSTLVVDADGPLCITCAYRPNDAPKIADALPSLFGQQWLPLLDPPGAQRHSKRAVV